MVRRVVMAALALGVAGLASAASTVSLFQAVSNLPCTTMEQTLATLQNVNGLYSTVISGRAANYEAMQAQLRQLKTVDVPYAGQDLSLEPLAEPTGLQNEYNRVGHQVADPNWDLATMPLVVGVSAGVAAAVNFIETPQYQSPDWKSVGSLALLSAVGIGAGIYFLTGTRTVYTEVPDPQAIAANARIRAQVMRQNEAIKKRNAATQKKLDARNAAIAKNQKIVDERSALVARMQAYENQSVALAKQEINSLDTEENRRCLDQLVYQASAIKLGTETSRVYLVVRPLTPDKSTMQNVLKRGVSFGVRSISVTDTKGVVARADHPSLFAVVPATAAPITVTYPPSFVALEFTLPMSRSVSTAAADLTIDAKILATQDGKQVQTKVHGSISPLP